ncbi:hybrid sensor histidine kinase/response regulator [Tumidithrix elongata RA019]|uniref:histidine kinase n=1 Tax=Tumidithrix elongata BACA0141 TaxID=2716417 RepID=A0AAW9Q4N6_9CYAN|nr:hybrid sensor histidine kinase/response regulator [Tumidithrix elongata RA019]
MIIEDEELRVLYKVASSEHIQKIEAGILHLEKHPQDTNRLEEMLREAHSLKGDSRMLGVSEAETLIHQIEEIFASVKKGETHLTSDLCDRLYKGVDAVSKIAHEAVTGQPANVQVFSVLAQLMGADMDEETAPTMESTNSLEASAKVSSEVLAQAMDDEALHTMFADFLKQENASSPSAEVLTSPATDPVAELLAESMATLNSESQAAINDYQIDTLRVESSRLDRLLTQASELLVTQGRFSDRTNDIQTIQNLWQEWDREAFASRLAFDELERRMQGSEELKPIRDFYHLVDRQLEQLGNLVNQLKNTASDDVARLEIVSKDLESGIRKLRQMPISTIFNLLPRSVRDLSRELGKEVELIVEGGDTPADKQILEAIKAPLSHLVRNAIDHGIESPKERQAQGKSPTAKLRLRAYQTSNAVCFEVQDDGRGLDLEAIKHTALRQKLHSEAELAAMNTAQIQSLIFNPGFSTRTNVSEISGRGVGLDVVRANVERLKGNLQLESTPGKGCLFRLTLKTNLATTYVLIVEVNQTIYALPLEYVQTMMLVSPQEIFAIEGSQTITFEGEPVSVVWLADLLGLSVSAPASTAGLNSGLNLPCIMMQIGTERLGVLVDGLLEQQEIVMKPQSKLLKRVRNIAGATIRGNGEVCMVLNPQDLFKSAKKGTSSVSVEEVLQQAQAKHRILLCDDSIPIRTQLKRILEGYGYDVTAAVDGQDGFDKLRTGSFDAVVSDVQMPNLDGLGLAARIRQFQEYDELPVVLITTLASEEDKRLGAQAGANAYLTKGDFDQRVLLDTLRRLI